MAETTTETKPVEKQTKDELLAEYQERAAQVSQEAGAETPEWWITNPKAAAKGKLIDSVTALRALQDHPDEPEAVAESEVEVLPHEPETAPQERGEATVPVEVEDEVGQAIALREEQPLAATTALPSPAEFNAARAVAGAIANSGVVPEAYRRKPDDVLAAILYGRELGMGPMTALRDIFMVDGKAALAAHRQLALLRRGGLVILESEATRERAMIKARRQDTGEVMTVEWTREEADQVISRGKPLTAKDNWKNYGPDMLWARCVGRLSRRLGPDLIAGLLPYTAEEVADFSGWGVTYDDTGEPRVYEPRPLSERRVEGPEYPWPQNQTELRDRLAKALGPEESVQWARQALNALYDRAWAELETAEKQDAGTRLSRVLRDIELEGGDLELRVDLREFIAGAFAKHFDGLALIGPPWRIGAGEGDSVFPLREEWEERQHEHEPSDEEAERLADATFSGPDGGYDS